MIRGKGWSEVGGDRLPWKKGDIFTLPARARSTHHADADSAFYWVHDEPLLRYLGVEATTARFRPTLYPQERADAELKIVEQDPEAAKRSRVSVLLANKEFPQTRTVTHVIWSMFGVLPARSVQLPHHHESVALDLIIDCEPGCYSLIGREIDKDGHIINPKRADWKSGSAFVTPPGLWHSHHNETGVAGAPAADPGRRAAYLPADPRHPLLPQGPHGLHLAEEVRRGDRMPAVEAPRPDGSPGRPSRGAAAPAIEG